MTPHLLIEDYGVDPAAVLLSFGLYLKPRGERIANPEPFHGNGVTFHLVKLSRSNEWRELCGSVIVTVGRWPETGDEPWLHASMTRKTRVPSYEDLCALKRAVWGEHGFAYQVFPDVDEHVSIHDAALHLWGRADGAPALPRFGALGTI